MMMQWRHAKNALASQAERRHLQNHGKRFQHKNTANKKQKNFLFDGHRDHTNRSAERQRSDVPHKHFRGMRVVPEKSKSRTHQSSAKNCKLAYLRKMLQVQVGRKARVAGYIGKYGERAR